MTTTDVDNWPADAMGVQGLADAFILMRVPFTSPEARLLNTKSYVEVLERDPRYGRAATDKPPKKVGSGIPGRETVCQKPSAAT